MFQQEIDRQDNQANEDNRADKDNTVNKDNKASTETMEKLLGKIQEDLWETVRKQGRAFLSIDGRCASGKTTTAAYLREKLNCNIISMDDFFLRKEQRTDSRMKEPGGNVDYERFITDVIANLQKGKNFSYQPFDCHTMSLARAVWVELETSPIVIVEGSYSSHPKLRDFYDLHLFMTTDKETQMQRILRRNGEEQARVFAQKWIPLEEKYFKACQIEEKCEYRIRT